MVWLKKFVSNSGVRFDPVGFAFPFQFLPRNRWTGAGFFRKLKGSTIEKLVIAISIWTIALVATYDLFLTIKFAASLDIYEMNPVGRAIMKLNYGEIHSLEPVALFSSCKFLGTLLVLMSIQGLSLFRRDWALIVSVALASFQLFLLTFFLL